MFGERFPLLERTVNGRRLVYLDSAATTQKPGAVIAAEARYYRLHNANVHRGMHTLGVEATDLYEGCRARVGRFLGLPAEQVVVTRGATSALNLVAGGLAPTLKPGDEILITEMEHHANLVPWLELARREGLVVRHIPVTDGGELELARLPELLNGRTRVVALTHVSNVLGTINPVAEIAALARRRGALVVVDAAQSVGHLPLAFDDLDCDFLVFSAHKTYGPMGLGFLAGRAEALERLHPVETGGEMIETVTMESATWAAIPQRFEAGTPNVAAAAAFPAALDTIDEATIERLRQHEISLTAYALERLQAKGGLTIYGPRDAARRGGLVAFHDPMVHPHDMAQLLDSLGVAVRAGHHCAQPLHRRLGVVATSRASFGMYNAHDDIDALIDGIGYARSVFGA
ncbi:MAG: SufS family cysteine desulfurase [bacterium]|nr:SufS family cysteine desulfurase [bacterium]